MDETVEVGDTSLSIRSVMWRQERKQVDMKTGQSFQYITDKALDIQPTLKHNNKTATLIS